MAVKAVLFDFDGTLVDTVDLIMESFRYATQHVLGRALPDEVLRENIGIPLASQMALFDADKAEELTRVYRAHNATVHDELVKEYPGVNAALAEIEQRGLPMAIITSKMHSVAMRAVDIFEMGQYFEFLIGADDVSKHKPDPYPLLQAAERLQVAPSACVYIGDSPHDIAAANSAGMTSIAARWGVFSAEDLHASHPDYSLDDISELPILLSQIG